jgi:uncharacterized paraquat-inducible protein A
MAEMHGGVLIFVGAFVIAFSIYIGFVKMLLFVIAGAVMIVIGATRLKKTKKHSHKTHHAQAAKPPPTSHYHPRTVMYCPKCGTVSHHGAYYCSRCGSRLVVHKR